jgi:hypothetical protein
MQGKKQMETWPGLLTLFEEHLKPFSPAPKTSHDKQECIAIQHFIYVLFVLFETIQSGESKIIIKEDQQTKELVYEDENYVISPTRNFLLYVNDLFGIKNVNLPQFNDAAYELICNAITLVSNDMPLHEMEMHIEQWISDNIDDEWNVYIELAENGDLSIETISHMQRIQKRLAVLGQKTFRRAHVNEEQQQDNPEQPTQNHPKVRRKIFLQKQTRKIKRLPTE